MSKKKDKKSNVAKKASRKESKLKKMAALVTVAKLNQESMEVEPSPIEMVVDEDRNDAGPSRKKLKKNATQGSSNSGIDEQTGATLEG